MTSKGLWAKIIFGTAAGVAVAAAAQNAVEKRTLLATRAEEREAKSAKGPHIHAAPGQKLVRTAGCKYDGTAFMTLDQRSNSQKFLVKVLDNMGGRKNDCLFYALYDNCTYGGCQVWRKQLLDIVNTPNPPLELKNIFLEQQTGLPGGKFVEWPVLKIAFDEKVIVPPEANIIIFGKRGKTWAPNEVYFHERYPEPVPYILVANITATHFVNLEPTEDISRQVNEYLHNSWVQRQVDIEETMKLESILRKKHEREKAEDVRSVEDFERASKRQSVKTSSVPKRPIIVDDDDDLSGPAIVINGGMSDDEHLQPARSKRPIVIHDDVSSDEDSPGLQETLKLSRATSSPIVIHDGTSDEEFPGLHATLRHSKKLARTGAHVDTKKKHSAHCARPPREGEQ